MSERLKKMKVCPKCSVMVNPENLRKHMRKAHGIEPEAELMQSLKDRTGARRRSSPP